MSSIAFLVIPVLAWFIAHLIKFTHKVVREDTIDFTSFISSGGVVSAHASVVTALAVTVGVLEGVRSSSFGIAAAFAFLVMYDSLATRRVVGEVTAHLRSMYDNAIDQGLLVSTRYRGHTPKEVCLGSALGGLLAAVFTFADWRERAAIIFESYPSPIGNLESQLYILAASIAIIVGLGINRYLRKTTPKKYQKLALIKRWVFANTTLVGIVGLLGVWLAYENVTVVTWRLWLYLVAGLGALSSARLVYMYHHVYRHEISEAVRKDIKNTKKKSKKKNSRKKRTKKRK